METSKLREDLKTLPFSALRDYESAIKLDPKNQELKTDAFKIRRTLQGGESSD